VSRGAAAFVLLTGLGAGAAPSAGNAQALADIELGGVVVKAADRDALRAGLFTARAGIAAGRWHVAAVGSLAAADSGGTASHGSGVVAGRAPLSPDARLLVEAVGGTGADLTRSTSGYVRGAAAIELETTRATLRLGASHAWAWLPETRRRTAGLRLGVSPRSRRLEIEGVASVLRYDEPWSLLEPRGSRRWVGDLALALRVRCRRCELSLGAGWRVAGRQPVLGEPEAALTVQGEARWWVADRVALVLASGRLPADIERGRVPVASLRAGVRVGWRAPSGRPDPAALSLAVSILAPGTYRLELRGHDSVPRFLRGDFSGWLPVRLEPLAPGSWATPPLQAAPGVWRLQMSRDGVAWTALPGLSRGPAEFGEDASVLVVGPDM
jgi:hypothetical protein